MRCHSRSCYDNLLRDKKNRPVDQCAVIRRKSCEGELFGKMVSLRKQRLYLAQIQKKKQEPVKKLPPNLRRILIDTKKRGSSPNIMKSHKTFTPLIKSDLDFSGVKIESPMSMKSMVSSPVIQRHTTFRASIHCNTNQPSRTQKVISPLISPQLSPTYRSLQFKSLHIDGPLLNKCKTTVVIKHKRLPTLREFKHKHHI